MKLNYATLRNYKRINGSNLGNPNYEIEIELGSGEIIITRSSSNSSWCYGISNSWINKPIAYHKMKSGRVDYLKLLELNDIFIDPIFKN